MFDNGECVRKEGFGLGGAELCEKAAAQEGAEVASALAVRVVLRGVGLAAAYAIAVGTAGPVCRRGHCAAIGPGARRVHGPQERAFKGCGEAEARAILERVQADWAAWRQSATADGFLHTS